MPTREPSDSLRHRIDRGETGDKVPALDPAAAPLGTDDEAGGASSDGPAAAADSREAWPGSPRTPAGQAAGSGPGTAGGRPPWAIAVLILLVCAAAVVAAVALMP